MKLAVAATFTADPLREAAEFWARRLGVSLDLEFAPFNQTIQTLLDPSGAFAHNPSGVNVLLVRFEDLGGGGDELLATLGQARARVVTVVCPPSRTWAASGEQRRLEDAFAARGAVNYRDVEALYPVGNPLSELGERVASLPYTDLYFAALGTFLMRRAHAMTRPPVKVLVLDCDNTLWKGVCGEDGPEGIELDAARRAVQEMAREQRSAGVVLALASKNVEEDVAAAFAGHPEFPLSLGDFSARRVDWLSKADGLESIAAELNLGLDSFVFVDDNPRECAEVRAFEPQVITLALPAVDAEIAEFLRHVWVFDTAALTSEDSRRGKLYEQSREFEGALAAAASLEDFYAGLELRVDVRPVEAGSIARAAQLTQRTNQFNFTTLRRTEEEIASMAGDCFIAQVRDRFGDHGLTGLVIARPAGGTLDVDTFLLSCRVLGRGVEHEMLRWLGRHAREAGCEVVRLRVIETAKNVPARDFLASVLGGYRDVYEVAAGMLDKVEFAPARPRVTVKPGAAPPAGHADYEIIARELRSPEQILAAMRPERAVAEGLTETEARLAAIWGELLAAPVEDRGANFFDLGGHSLLAVQLLLRVQETFGIELPIDEVYSTGMTLGGLAETIDAISLADLDSGEYAELLREIESLSDDEVREQLSREPRSGD